MERRQEQLEVWGEHGCSLRTDSGLTVVGKRRLVADRKETRYDFLGNYYSKTKSASRVVCRHYTPKCKWERPSVGVCGRGVAKLRLWRSWLDERPGGTWRMTCRHRPRCRVQLIQWMSCLCLVLSWHDGEGHRLRPYSRHVWMDLFVSLLQI